MMEEDPDFFPAHPFSEGELETGYVKVLESTLDDLDQELQNRLDRARYYNEYNFTQLEFSELIRHIQNLANAVRRSTR